MSTQEYEINAWLGPAVDDLDEEQWTRFADVWRDVGARYPDPDEQAERNAALTAAVQFILAETTPAEAGRALDQARTAQIEALAAARQVAIMAVEDGAYEHVVADELRVTRRTVRKWQGKAG